MAHLYTQQSEEMREDEDERNEEESASGCRYDIGSDRLADGLHQHVSKHDGGYQRKTDYLPLQGYGTYGHYMRVITEKFDDLL